MSLFIGKTHEVTQKRTRTVEVRQLHLTLTLDEVEQMLRPMLAKINPAFENGEIERHVLGGYCDCEPDAIKFIVDLEVIG